MLRNPKVLRVCSLFLLIQFTTQTLFIPAAYALTSGPSQPEFTSFEPVAATNMVNEFTGDFTYNLPVIEVPGPQGSSYPISLSYHSGVGPEEEASWVGYGWTLNPGAINRNMRGLPDDYNGNKITHYNKMPKNWTGTVGTQFGFGEIFGIDLKKIAGAQLSLGTTFRYNNYRGFGYNAGVGLTLGKGLVSMGYNVSDGSGSFSWGVNPSAVMSWSVVNADRTDIWLKVLNRQGYKQKLEKVKVEAINASPNLGVSSTSLMGSSYGIFSYNNSSHPNIVHPYKGNSFNLTIGLEANVIIVPVGGTVNLSGSYSYQENEASREIDTYGYLYSGSADSDDAMDYHVEYEKDFNKRDVFLGVPFNDADNFIVTGEGLGGGFRLYNKTAGHFGPTTTESNTTIYNLGGEIGVGWTFGPGVDLGIGSHKLTVHDWNRLSSFNEVHEPGVDEPVFFRFNNDMGGEWGTNYDDRPFHVNLSKHSISLPSLADKYSASDERSGRSSYIGYTTNSSMLDGTSPSHYAYSKNEKVNEQAERANAAYDDLIGELAVFNELGNRYVYGLPVHAKNEKSLSYSAEGLTSVENNFIGYTSSPNEKVKVGEEKNDPYASTYLLTEITTPDYLDRGEYAGGENGPSVDDLGGYTRFNYQKNTAAGDWFKWRSPFKGMLYQKNSRSDQMDDLVSYAEGEKEIYYLHSIETKTHVAIFKTSLRRDGMEAQANAWSSASKHGCDGLNKLDNIKLYTLADCLHDENTGALLRDEHGSPRPDDDAKPIKTVHFNFDYTLCKGLPNSFNVTSCETPDEGLTGKLTLKRLYTEYNDIHDTRISPYLFSYQYPTASEYAAFPAMYTTDPDPLTEDVRVGYVTDGTDGLTAGEQNPDYNEFLSDPWGSYQKNGTSRFTELTPWVAQNAIADFDPAAWHLKKITLPSGGEILVQYEQDDYNYVQNQEAHVMAPLKYEPGNNRYVIDHAKIGLSVDDLDQLQKMITKRYVGEGKKIYFKLLYSLIGNNMPNLATCNAEFITGYASVSSCVKENNELVIYLVPGLDQLPTKVCTDFVKAQRLGKLDPDANCDPSQGVSDPTDPEALVNQLLAMAGGILLPNDQLCKHVNPTYSYLRIPTAKAKKGGGTRVKRLMMFDKGFEGNSVLYGSEYTYKTKEVGTNRIISSGVATNEPQIIREENILVDFIQRGSQDAWSRIIAGKDRDQAEGPLGESILPGPSVGYSKVIVQNIYTGKTNPGITISEFHTAYSDPIALAQPNNEATMTGIKRHDLNPIPISLPFFTYIKSKTSAVQGFSFVLNSMHGQPMSTASYNSSFIDIHNPASGSEVNRVFYEYYKPGETIPVMSSIYEGVKPKNPGREVDITFAQRRVEEIQNDVNVEADIQLTIIPLAFIVLVIPYPTATPSFSHIEGELNTHTTTKVVRYPAIVKKMTTTQNGITHEEETMAFDEFTGKPVAVRSTDEFKGAYLAQSIPASWEYPDMGGKWKNQNKKITGAFNLEGEYLDLGTDPCNLAEFTRGDEIRLGGSTSKAFYHVIERDYINNRLKVEPVRNSIAPSGSISEISLVHSGRTNQLQQQAGNITVHNEEKNLAAPLFISEVNRYETTENTFVQAFNAATIGLSGTGNFELPGTFLQMDMSGFADKLSTCNIDLTNATVRQLEYRYLVNDGQLTLELMSFEIKCVENPEQWITIKAEGWE